MKLLTHNMLMCNIKGVKKGYPLKLEATQFEEREADFNPDFLRHLFAKVDWPALLQAAQSVSCGIMHIVSGRLRVNVGTQKLFPFVASSCFWLTAQYHRPPGASGGINA